MNKASERYNTKVEIPISVILETIFSDDNKDVETLCRWAKHYGYVDLIKENGDKLGYYKLQDDYNKQSFYVLLDKEERKQYDYEDYLLDEIQRRDNIIKIMENYLELIYDLGYDHDGCETTSDLMSLIDEIVRYASLGRVYNTTETIYVNGNEKYNILHEKIEGHDE